MALYCLNDIFNDIETFERIRFNRDECLRQTELLKDVQFTKLYSDVYCDPADKLTKDEDIKERINKFINTQILMLPAHRDKEPDFNHRFTLYKYKSEDYIGQLQLEFVECADTYEELNVLFNREYDGFNLCLFNTVSEEVVYYKSFG